jgi:hypothetical protein
MSIGGKWISSSRPARGRGPGIQCGGVAVHLGATPTSGIRIEISGAGCREIEYRNPTWDWQSFFIWLLANGARFSRIDVTIDYFGSTFTIPFLTKCAYEHRIVTRIKPIRPQREIDSRTGQITETALNLGSAKSPVQLRIYDKSFTEPDNPRIRFEYQARKTSANDLATRLSAVGVIAIQEVFATALDIRDVGTSSRRARWKRNAEWNELLNGIGRKSIGSKRQNATIEHKLDHITRQYSITFALLREEYGSDIFDKIADLGDVRLHKKGERARAILQSMQRIEIREI